MISSKISFGITNTDLSGKYQLYWNKRVISFFFFYLLFRKYLQCFYRNKSEMLTELCDSFYELKKIRER